ncbi:hypothetical protein EDD75_0326 [Thermodesulfitimonas autotrophica]|uniref:Uncharacterized protein n=1 Tax=Thermodesulfitimonas autotrophica TaxID=1894989 RepID=A0A3N5B1L6_9THEO|nr:hypothetical protein [Thermodesulfitimonas autotrophica]RPF49510.1 hypothetical protein EDD75_0326 [Thermodesulfitimonas autotrophica]
MMAQEGYCQELVKEFLGPKAYARLLAVDPYAVGLLKNLAYRYHYMTYLVYQLFKLALTNHRPTALFRKQDWLPRELAGAQKHVEELMARFDRLPVLSPQELREIDRIIAAEQPATKTPGSLKRGTVKVLKVRISKFSREVAENA